MANCNLHFADRSQSFKLHHAMNFSSFQDPASYLPFDIASISNAKSKPNQLITQQQIRLSEVIAALSVALDITQGHAKGHCMRSCLIGMRIAQELSLDEADRSALFYALLLKDLGCSSNAARISYLFEADDLNVKHSLRMIDWTRPTECLSHFWKHAAPEGTFWARVFKVWSAVKQGPEPGRKLSEMRCNRGAAIARMLQLPEATAQAILDIDELWNGGGAPLRKKGQEISRLGRICCLAQTTEVFYSRNRRVLEAYDVARKRKGRWFDPEIVQALEAFENDRDFWQQMNNENIVEELGRYEPLDQIMIADEDCLDRVAEAFAQVVDAKSPWTFQHSTRVAEISVGIAKELQYSPEIIKDVRRAALLHDVGKLGVSNRILDKPGRPSEEEFTQIKRHPEYTYRILSQVEAFRELAFVAAGHHERLDGQGYHLRFERRSNPWDHSYSHRR